MSTASLSGGSSLNGTTGPAGGSGGTSGGSTSGGRNAGGASGEAGQIAAVTTSSGGHGAPPEQGAGVAVLTHYYNSQRTGANLAEALLTTANVSTKSFARLATWPVRGAVYAQPLYLPQLDVPELGQRNVAFVATVLNYVYAFDADEDDMAPHWVRQLGPPERPPYSAFEPGTFSELGIMSTPVISTDEHALYVVAHVVSQGTAGHRLHKLNLSTGEDLVPPVTIEDPGFDASHHAQLSALLLAEGRVYVAFGNPLLNEGGYGRLFAYDAATLEKVAALSSVDAQQIGPIWMAGQGPSWDGESIYVAADAPDTYSTPEAFGSRLLKLRPPGAAFTVEDWFLPSYVRAQGWTELGSSGALRIPGEDRVLLAGNRAVYLLDRNALGGYVDEDAQIVQKFVVREVGSACPEGSACNRIHTSPVYWDRETDPLVYLWAHNDPPRAFVFDRNTASFDCGSAPAPDCESIAEGEDIGIWGQQSLALSAFGETPGSGILWTVQRDMNGATLLRARDAETLDTLWSSAKGELGPWPSHAFAPPVITGGRVFVPALDGLSHAVRATSESALGSPALAVHDRTQSLVAAWVGGSSGSLIVAWSSDGRSFDRWRPLLKTSRSDPALASDGDDGLYLAYVDAENKLRVESSQSPEFEDTTVLLDLDETDSPGNPALAFGDGRLYLAWRDESSSSVVVLTTEPNEPFDPAVRTLLPVHPTSQPPTLFTSGSRVFVAVTGTTGELEIHESNDKGSSFDLTATLPVTIGSSARPALAQFQPPSFDSPAWYLFWFDDGATSELHVLSGDADWGSLVHDRRLAEHSPLARLAAPEPVAATAFLGGVYVAWTLEGQVQVARYTPGEVAVYGLTHSP